MKKVDYKNYSKAMLVLCVVYCMEPDEFTNSGYAWLHVNDPEWDEAFENYSMKSRDELVKMLEERQEEHEQALKETINVVKRALSCNSDEEVFEIFNEVKAQREQEKAKQYAWRSKIIAQLNQEYGYGKNNR